MNPRRALEWAVPVVATVVVVTASVVAAGDLPSPMAIHWGPGGEPDGAGPLWAATLLVVGLVGPLAGVSLWAAGRAPTRRTARLIVATVAGSCGFFATLHLLTLAANAGAPRWQEAGSLPVGGLLGPTLGVGLVLGLLGWWSAGDRPDPEVETYPADDITIEPGEAVVWTGSATGPLAILLPVAGLLLAGILWSVSPDPGLRGAATGLALVALMLAVALRIRTTVGPGGLTVAFGPFGWPRLRIRLEEIADVAVEHVEPMAYGGWGYRLVPGARGVIMRRGEGVRITRRGRPDLVVTLPQARTAAGVLLAHLDAARAVDRRS